MDRDWYRPQGPGNRYKQSNTWDYPDSEPEDFDRYFTGFAKPQVEEILTKYQPDVLWFDGIDMKSDAQALDLYQTIRRLRPACVINSRIKGCVPPKTMPPPLCDYLSSGDNEILKGNIGFEWENPGSMNTSFGHNPNDLQGSPPPVRIGKDAGFTASVAPARSCRHRRTSPGWWFCGGPPCRG